MNAVIRDGYLNQIYSGNNMKGIDSYISQLTSKERESHKDLIDECRRREKEIADNEKSALESAGRLVELSGHIVKNLESLGSMIKELDELSKKSRQNSDKQVLSRISDDKFFHA